MAKSLSEDIRSRVVAAVQAGLSRRGAATRFGVSVASAVRWSTEWQTTGSTCAKPQGGDRRSGRIEAFGDVILAAITAQADITLVELATVLREQHGVSFSASTIWRFLDRHNMTIKKNGTRQRAGAARRCRAARSVARSPA